MATDQRAPGPIASHYSRLEPRRLETERVLIVVCREVGRRSLGLKERWPIMWVGGKDFSLSESERRNGALHA
jgi:hypothetical protein